MQQAAVDNEFDKFVQADGKLNYGAIAQAAGLNSRQAGYAAVKQTVDKIAGQLGTTVDGMKGFLKNRTKQIRTTEAADADMLGMNPKDLTHTSMQAGAQLDNADLMGNDEGVTAGFGTIESVGGSQGSVGENVQPTETDMARPDPVAEKRASEAKDRYVALQSEALSRAEAGEAAADWDDMRGSHAPFAKDLSRQDAYDWLMSYMEWKYGDITEEQLAVEQRDIERRYDADPAKAAIGRDGTGAGGPAEPAALAEGEVPAGKPSEDNQAETGADEDPLIGLLAALRRLSKTDKHQVVAQPSFASSRDAACLPTPLRFDSLSPTGCWD